MLDSSLNIQCHTGLACLKMMLRRAGLLKRKTIPSLHVSAQGRNPLESGRAESRNIMAINGWTANCHNSRLKQKQKAMNIGEMMQKHSISKIASRLVEKHPACGI